VPPPPIEAERYAGSGYLEMYMPRAKKTSTKTPSKSDFIRAQPATLSAAEVVAKAKTAGVTILPGLVYEVRRKAKGRSKGKPKKSAVANKTGVSTKTTSTSTKPTKSKAAFVRGLPASTPASEVVKQARAAGIKLGVSYVYNIRGAAKMAAKKKRAAAKSPTVAAVTNGGGSTVSASAQHVLKAVAAELGLGAAIEILAGERARVRAVIAG
jgi:hypothetical protein